jgi:hypothetical protein
MNFDRNINNILGECMKILADFTSSENDLSTSKTLPYRDVIDVVDVFLENIDITMDKIKVNNEISKFEQ